MGGSLKAQETPQGKYKDFELEKENEDRRRLQAVSREERVLNKLESIAFGDAPYAGKLKAMEPHGKHICFFTPTKVSGVERSADALLLEIC